MYLTVSSKWVSSMTGLPTEHFQHQHGICLTCHQLGSSLLSSLPLWPTVVAGSLDFLLQPLAPAVYPLQPVGLVKT